HARRAPYADRHAVGVQGPPSRPAHPGDRFDPRPALVLGHRAGPARPTRRAARRGGGCVLRGEGGREQHRERAERDHRAPLLGCKAAARAGPGRPRRAPPWGSKRLLRVRTRYFSRRARVPGGSPHGPGVVAALFGVLGVVLVLLLTRGNHAQRGPVTSTSHAT